MCVFADRAHKLQVWGFFTPTAQMPELISLLGE